MMNSRRFMPEQRHKRVDRDTFRAKTGPEVPPSAQFQADLTQIRRDGKKVDFIDLTHFENEFTIVKETWMWTKRGEVFDLTGDDNDTEEKEWHGFEDMAGVEERGEDDEPEDREPEAGPELSEHEDDGEFSDMEGALGHEDPGGVIENLKDSRRRNDGFPYPRGSLVLSRDVGISLLDGEDDDERFPSGDSHANEDAPEDIEDLAALMDQPKPATRIVDASVSMPPVLAQRIEPTRLSIVSIDDSGVPVLVGQDTLKDRLTTGIRPKDPIGTSTTIDQATGFTLIDPGTVPNASRDPDSGQWHFSHELFRDSRGQRVNVHICLNLRDAEEAAKKFVGCRMLGLDSEWIKGGAGGKLTDRLSLIQLASESDIALFHLARFGSQDPKELMPPTLKSVLGDRSIIKAGSRILLDANKIFDLLGCRVSGLMDLAQYLQAVRPEDQKQSNGLGNMTSRLLGLTLAEKTGPKTIVFSAWTEPLDRKQRDYAANDAYASLRVFLAIDAERVQRGMPPMTYLLKESREPNQKSAKRRKDGPNGFLDEALRNLRDQFSNIYRKQGWTKQTMTNEAIDKIVQELPSTSEELQTMVPALQLPQAVTHTCSMRIVAAVASHRARHGASKKPRLLQSKLSFTSNNSSPPSSSQSQGLLSSSGEMSHNLLSSQVTVESEVEDEGDLIQDSTFVASRRTSGFW